MNEINIQATIPGGWRLQSVDLSMSPRVTFTRDHKNTEWWLTLSEEQQEFTPLYICGFGISLETAINDGINEIKRLDHK